ncbi:MAG: hypothetical protein JSV88_26500 [Candidatus Aminicenantes bacterium]|nr:MAG: hypothetical protein JSV88_26500 [Candidatus Aminicenantes bacterium]
MTKQNRGMAAQPVEEGKRKAIEETAKQRCIDLNVICNFYFSPSPLHFLLTIDN